MRGILIKGIAGFYYVKTGAGIYQCKARGIFKKQGITPLVGDDAEIEVLEDGDAVINGIAERKNSFIRPPIANVDCFMIVIAAAEPEPSFSIIDRFLVMAEKNNTEAVICINKTDLVTIAATRQITEIYEGLYPVVCTSGLTGGGLADLKQLLRNRRCALAGPSGAGKSTLLNLICPEVNVKTGEISRKTSRGKHTTRHAELFDTDFGAMIFDTPGFTSFDVPDVELSELQHLYPEIARCFGQCKYSNCSHLKEQDCAVRKACREGGIKKSRYSSYREQYQEIKENQPY